MNSKCRGCGTPLGECLRRGTWSSCCGLCDQTDNRSHPQPVQQRAPQPQRVRTLGSPERMMGVGTSCALILFLILLLLVLIIVAFYVIGKVLT